jgi:hypothetical protein
MEDTGFVLPDVDGVADGMFDMARISPIDERPSATGDYVTACPVHKCLLVDTCDECGRQLSDRNAGTDYGWACVCDRELADMAQVPAPEAALDVARMLYRHIGPGTTTGYILLSKTVDPKVALFDRLPLNDLLSAIELIGTVAVSSTENDPLVDAQYLPARTGGRRGNRLDGGHDDRIALDHLVPHVVAALGIMRGWPEAWYDQLDRLAERAKGGSHHLPDRRILGTKLGHRCLSPDRGIDGTPLAIILDATDRWLEARHGVKRRQRTHSMRNPVALVLASRMNASMVAKRLGIPAYTADFKRIYEAVLEEMAADAADMTPRKMAAELLRRVRTRMHGLADTVASFEASEMLEGIVAERSLTGWDHPKLIEPVEGMDGLVKKRKASYRRNDIERLTRRMAKIAAKVDDVGDLESVTALMRRTLSADYRKTDLLLDIFDGTLPTCRLVESPRLADLYADPVLAKRRASSRWALRLIENDETIQPSPLRKLIGVLWEQQIPLDIKAMRKLRETGRIRFEKAEVWSDGRSHPLYRYNVGDMLMEIHRTHGRTSVSDLDNRLRA